MQLSPKLGKSDVLNFRESSEGYENALIELKLPSAIVQRNSKLKCRHDVEMNMPSLPQFVDK